MVELGEGTTSPQPAASVILVRDKTIGFEILLLKRNNALRHMPGIWVFPGGKVDPMDSGADPAAIARSTAVRELSEEAGIQLTKQDLIPFSHWLTPVKVRRRFSTWFFLAKASSDGTVTIDNSEVVDHQWLPPKEAIELHTGGNLDLTPPTLVSLKFLSAFGTPVGLFRAVHERSIPNFFPKVVKKGYQTIFLYEGDAAYENEDLDQVGALNRTIGRGKYFNYVFQGGPA